MGKFAQLVMGPAGSGKSTYCAAIKSHCELQHRTCHVVNLDPAADKIAYEPSVDVRELVSLDDVVEELGYGPNGGLVYCMEYVIDNLDWLEEVIGDFDEDYLVIDCPGQIELYTHLTVMRTLISTLEQWGYRVCSVYLLDSTFVADVSKLISGIMNCLSAMLRLETPHINVLSKMDVLKRDKNDEFIDSILDPSMPMILDRLHTQFPPQHRRLNEAIGTVLEEYGMVNFVPLDITSEQSLTDVLSFVDNTMQYGEDLEPKEPGDLEDKEIDEFSDGFGEDIIGNIEIPSGGFENMGLEEVD